MLTALRVLCHVVQGYTNHTRLQLTEVGIVVWYTSEYPKLLRRFESDTSQSPILNIAGTLTCMATYECCTFSRDWKLG